MLQDLRFGLKMLWKQKAFSIAALLTLALCIGANTAIFTILEGVVLRPLAYPEAGRLVTMYNLYPGVGFDLHGANAVPDYFDRRKLNDVFSDVALIGGRGFDVGFEGSPRRIDGQFVTPSYFRTLRVQPALGRGFLEEEAYSGKEKVAILSHSLWREMFAGDRSALGRDIRLSGVPHRIVGVMGEDFVAFGTEARIWVPFGFTKEQMADDSRHSNSFGMIARLQPGVSVARAQERIHQLNRINLERFPELKPLLTSARFRTEVSGWQAELIREIRPTIYLLQIAVFVVLLIGCVNLANLMLVRSTVRIRELAIRFSLGAGRWRIGRQLLTESVLLAVMGGAFGAFVGYLGVRLLTTLGEDNIPNGIQIGMNPGVLAFTGAVAVLTGIAFGSVPLFHLWRRDLNEVFRGTERGSAAHGTISLRSGLVVCQFAMAFILLIGAGLLTMSFLRVLNVDPGFRPENVLSAAVSLPDTRYKEDAPARQFLTRAIESLQSTPGVKRVAFSSYLPFGGNQNASVISIYGRPLRPGENPPVPGWARVSSGYFAAMGMPLLRGRGISESDGPESPQVVVIDQYLAKRFWPGDDAIGAKIMRGVPALDKEQKEKPWTIVGIVGSVKTGDLAEQNPTGMVYFPYTQFVPRGGHLVVRSAGDNPQLTATLRQRIAQIDPEMPLFDTRSMPERLSRSVGNRRAAMVLCLIFGALALLLAAIGIYGVLAYSVTQRTREFGIRVALGAGVRDVVGMVTGHGIRLAAAGLLIGVAGAFALTRLMGSLLYEVRPADPAVYLITGLLLGAVALVASLIPALRALRIRPASALRYE